MGGFSIWHWLVVGIIILLLFGKGRFSSMMGDVAQGLKSFKKGMAEEDEAPHGQRSITREPGAPEVTVRETRVDPVPPRTATPEHDDRRV